MAFTGLLDTWAVHEEAENKRKYINNCSRFGEPFDRDLHVSMIANRGSSLEEQKKNEENCEESTRKEFVAYLSKNTRLAEDVLKNYQDARWRAATGKRQRRITREQEVMFFKYCFDELDTRNAGFVDSKQFHAAMTILVPGVKEHIVTEIFRKANGGSRSVGGIDLTEFIEGLMECALIPPTAVDNHALETGCLNGMPQPFATAIAPFNRNRFFSSVSLRTQQVANAHAYFLRKKSAHDKREQKMQSRVNELRTIRQGREQLRKDQQEAKRVAKEERARKKVPIFANKRFAIRGSKHGYVVVSRSGMSSLERDKAKLREERATEALKKLVQQRDEARRASIPYFCPDTFTPAPEPVRCTSAPRSMTVSRRHCSNPAKHAELTMYNTPPRRGRSNSVQDLGAMEIELRTLETKSALCLGDSDTESDSGRFEDYTETATAV